MKRAGGETLTTVLSGLAVEVNLGITALIRFRNISVQIILFACHALESAIIFNTTGSMSRGNKSGAHCGVIT